MQSNSKQSESENQNENENATKGLMQSDYIIVSITGSHILTPGLILS